MLRDRAAGRRAFRPTLDGLLEVRCVLSQFGGIRAAAAAAARPGLANFIRSPRVGSVHTAVGFGGGVAVITDTDGEMYEASLVGLGLTTNNTSNTANSGSQPLTTTVQVAQGTVRGFPMPGGRVGLIVDGTTGDSELDINPLSPHRNKGTAHDFNGLPGRQDGVLHIGAIIVTSGKIGQINAFHTAVLEGPVLILGNVGVDRIAFQAIRGAGSITTGGDLNTLDVINDVTLTSGTGINVGRDLNWFDTGGNVSLSGGANIVVNRDLGRVAQPAKGTGTGGQGVFINGNLSISPDSALVVGRSVDAPVVIAGTVSPETQSRVFVGTQPNG